MPEPELRGGILLLALLKSQYLWGQNAEKQRAFQDGRDIIFAGRTYERPVHLWKITFREWKHSESR